MAWDDKAPTDDELKASQSDDWSKSAPTDAELKAADPSLLDKITNALSPSGGTGSADPAGATANVLGQPENYPFVKAMGRSAAQTVGFGLPDELEAALRSKSLKGPEYDAALRKAQEEYKEAARASPAGNLTGMALGAGLILPAADVAAGTLGLSTAGSGLLAKSGIGAFQGGIAGAGSSENTLNSNPVGLLKDTGIGAVVGSAFPLMGELMGPAETAAGGLAKTAGMTAVGAGTGALLDPNNPMQGAQNGAELALGAKALSSGLSGLANNTEIGNIYKRAKELGKQGVVLSTSDHYLSEYSNALHDVSTEANKLAKMGTDVKSDRLYKGLKNLEDDMDRFLTTTKKASGQTIGEVRGLIKDTNTDMYVKDMTDKVHDLLDDAVVPEEYKEQLRKKLDAMVKTTTPDVASTEQQVVHFDPETGNFAQGPSKIKVGGKNINKEDLFNLQNSAESQSPGNASITTLNDADGNPTKQVTSQQTLYKQPEVPVNTNLDGLLQLRKTFEKDLGSADGQKRTLANQAYKAINEKIESLIQTPEDLAKYKAANQTYSQASNLSDELLNSDKGLQKKIGSQIKGYNAGNGEEDRGELEALLNKVKDLETKELSPAGTAGTSSFLNQDINDISNEYQTSKSLKPLADQSTGKQTAANQMLDNSKFKQQISPWKQNLELMKKVDPERAAALEKKASQVSEVNDLLGLNKTPFESDALPSSTEGVVKKLTGGLKSNLAKAGNKQGLVSRAMMENPQVSADFAQQADAKGYTQLSRILRKAAGSDNVSRAATLYTIQTSPAYNEQFKNLLQVPNNESDNDDKVVPDYDTDK